MGTDWLAAPGDRRFERLPREVTFSKPVAPRSSMTVVPYTSLGQRELMVKVMSLSSSLRMPRPRPLTEASSS